MNIAFSKIFSLDTVLPILLFARIAKSFKKLVVRY